MPHRPPLARPPAACRPEKGFPVGTSDAPVAEMSWHSVVHGVAAAVAFTALAVAAIVLTVRYVRRGPCGTSADLA